MSEPRYRIIKNAAKCLKCDDIVESKHRHDFRQCLCGNLSVDGGKDYVRRAYEDSTAVEEMSEYEEVKLH